MEYEALIDRILEAEQTAQEITREAHEKEARMEADLEKEAAEVRADYFAKADQRLAELRRETEESRAQAIAAQDARFRDAMAKIERAYSRYGDNWVDTMFRQTVGQRP
jgi:vacuolar-type H+-ATPase subunit H